jgi:hypothetical protein
VFLFFGDTEGTNQWAKANLFPQRDTSNHARPVNWHKSGHETEKATEKARKGKDK